MAIALALAAVCAPGYAGTTGGNFNVDITLTVPGAPPPPGVSQPQGSGGVCISQALSDATGATVQVLCNPGQFVSIESSPGSSAYLGVHGGAFRYYFADGVPEYLRYMGGAPWVGPGTVTSIRITTPEGPDGLVEMQVGF